MLKLTQKHLVLSKADGTELQLPLLDHKYRIQKVPGSAGPELWVEELDQYSGLPFAAAFRLETNTDEDLLPPGSFLPFFVKQRQRETFTPIGIADIIDIDQVKEQGSPWEPRLRKIMYLFELTENGPGIEIGMFAELPDVLLVLGAAPGSEDGVRILEKDWDSSQAA